MTAVLIALAGFVSWVISTLSGGGGALLMTPVVGYLLGARAIAPVVTLTSALGSPARIYLFWRDIDWQIVRWVLPGMVVGGAVGAWVFAQTSAEGLQLIVAAFLISTVVQFRFGKRARAFPMRLWAFLPVGFGVAFFSGLVGATGPVLNPFYLSYGADKETLVGTKSVASAAMQLTKLGTYATLGSFPRALLLYGLLAGVAAIGANGLGKRWLARFSSERFRQFAIAVMVVSGGAMIWDQRAVLADLWSTLVDFF